MNFFPEFARGILIGLMIIIPLFMIYKKAGFHPIWALFVFLPGLGLLLIFLQLAFMPWPNQKQNNGEKS